MGLVPEIEYIDMPDELRDQYQYFTEAKTDKLRSLGCPVDFSSLENSVGDYIQNYLRQTDPHLGNNRTA